MDETIKALVSILASTFDRLEEAEQNAAYWKDLAGKEAVRASKLEAASLAASSTPNGSEKR